eukprot:TRINITY_DN17370_c0_g1_i1.p1 TRINITY_DN17370_c0_g1~~TRINITY_DN17370_c0_g1_i1.p1  ORF type:complete len:1189 (+),score=219.29 TRINITY_DN17370_c0_g1_i1:514-3567(+)
MRCMGGTGCMVFEKILRLSQPACVSYGAGTLANIMQVDTFRFQDTFFFVHFLWSMPLMLFVAMGMTYQMLTWASFMPLLFMACTYKLNKLLAMKLMQLGASTSFAMDARVKILTESLHAVRLCKMLGWEQQIADLVEKKRSHEMSIIASFKSWMILISLLFGQASNAILQLITFGAFVLLGGELSAGIVFSSLALFDLLQIPMNLFPITIQFLTEMSVSIGRIERLLLAEEIQSETPQEAAVSDNCRPKYIRAIAGAGTGEGIARVSAATFRWAAVPEEVPSAAEGGQTVSWSRRCLRRFLRRDEVVAEQRVLQRPGAAPLLSSAVATDHPVPRQVTLSVSLLEVLQGKLVFVCGPVGAGKSTLLSAFLGEVPQHSGRVELLGSVAYCAQVSWILHGTVRENIIFGREYNEEQFQKVVQVCALEHDLQQLKDGASTIIGERGINLSGGQKARISLARAAYSAASVLLLDDPLSAVDAHVASHLMTACLGSNGYLRKATRILVSHQIQFAQEADLVVLLRNGEVQAIRPPSEFSVSELRSAEAEMPTSPASLPQSSQRSLTGTDELTRMASNHVATFKDSDILDELHLGAPRLRALPRGFNLRRHLSEQVQSSPALVDMQRSASAPAPTLLQNPTVSSPAGKLEPNVSLKMHEVTPKVMGERFSAQDLEAGEQDDCESAQARALALEQENEEEREEEQEEGALSARVWCTFARAMPTGLSIVLLCFVASSACSLGSTFWLAAWSARFESLSAWEGLEVYAIISLLVVFFQICRMFIFRKASLSLSESLHRQALWAVIRSPMWWHDTTPTGRVVNRFSNDMQQIDMNLQNNMSQLFQSIFQLVTSMMVVITVVPILLVVVLPTMLVYWKIQAMYRASSREIQRMASKTKSPIFQGLDEAILGVSTIRAYCKASHFTMKNVIRVSRNIRMEFTRVGCQRWLGLRLQLMGIYISAGVAVLIVLRHHLGPFGRAISGPAAGMALRYASAFCDSMEGILNGLTQVEQCLVAVERLTTYTELET